MGHISKKMIAVSFTGPEMSTVFGALIRISGEVVFAKSKYDDFTDFECEVFAGQKHAVSWNKSQNALIVLRQSSLDRYPVSRHHFPVKEGLRFSKNAATPSA
jgi:hypothetical protein